jgi:putative Mg2+ transporter-C (MgtC) family protein
VDGGYFFRQKMDVSTTEQLHMFSRLVIAGGFGALVGLEREVRGYPAGIRTMGLVALGACLFTDVSQLMGAGDRVAAQIVTGIGFIGGGVILQAQGKIHGVTTAATIWAAAAIGMAVGLSLYWVGGLAAAFIVLALELRPITRRIDLFLYGILGRIEESEENDDLGVLWSNEQERRPRRGKKQ